jgi:hypothetical protein
MYAYGKAPFVPSSDDVMWRDIRPKGLVIPTVPKPHGGFGTDFVNWGLFNNGPSTAWPAGWAAAEGVGNCVLVDKFHAFMASAKNSGRPIPAYDDKLAVAQYALLVAMTGGKPYDPQSGANDNGLDIRTVLTHCQTVGLPNLAGQVNKIGPFIGVEPGNFAEMWEVLWFAEHISMGIEAPESMEQQVQAGQEITYVPGSPIVGGHDILLEGHPKDNMWTGVQWGQRTPMVPDFITHQADEMWAWFDPESISLTLGEDYEGFNPSQLEEYLATVAQTFPV